MVTDKVTDGVTDNQKLIIDKIRVDENISTSELASHIGLSQRKVKENIKKLKEIGILKRIGTAKGGRWQIVNEKVTDNQKLIIDKIRVDENISTSELASHIGLSQRKVKENIKKLKEIGILKRIGTAKGGRWQIINDKVTDKVTGGVTDKVTDEVTDGVTDNQKLIIDMIRVDENISTGELASQVGLSQRKIKENIKKLKEKGIVERIGSPKGGRWQIIKNGY